MDIKHNGNVFGFVEKPRPEDAPSNLINAGAYYLQPEVLDYITTGRLVSMEKEIFPQIISDTKRFYGYQLSGYWIDVGRISSYFDVHKLLLKEKNIDFIIGKHTIHNGIATTSCLGNYVTIHSGVHLSECVVLDHSKIDKNSSCIHCVIGENVQIGENVHLRNVVVGDNEAIASGTNLENSIIWNQSIPEGYPQKQIGNVVGE